MEGLRDIIKEYSDEELLDQYINHHDEYVPQALELIENEIKIRKIDTDAISKNSVPVPKQGAFNMNSKDFVLFEHTFTKIDLLIASSILRENEVIFFADNPSSSDFIPTETENSQRFSIHVHKQFEQKAHELLDEHFEKAGAQYLSKYTDAKDRLKTFNFHDIRISEKEAKRDDRGRIFF
jgi:hypothetical protein